MADKLRVLFFSDLHAHRWKYVGDESYASVIDKAFVTAKSMRCDVVCFAGDLFHSTTSLAPDIVASIVRAFLCGIVDLGLPVWLVTGNHDICRGQSVLAMFKPLPNVEVVTPNTGAKGITMNGVSVALVPYERSNKFSVKTRRKIRAADFVVTHNEFPGLRHNAQVVSSSGLGRDDYPAAIPIINGHYHVPQGKSASNIVCIGAPMSHSFADVDTPNQDLRGFLVGTFHADGKPKPVYERLSCGYPRFYSDDNGFQVRLGTDYVRTKLQPLPKNKNEAGRDAKVVKRIATGKTYLKDYALLKSGLSGKELQALVRTGERLHKGEQNT